MNEHDIAIEDAIETAKCFLENFDNHPIPLKSYHAIQKLIEAVESPVVVPSVTNASVANDFYGERYGFDWVYEENK